METQKISFGAVVSLLSFVFFFVALVVLTHAPTVLSALCQQIFEYCEGDLLEFVAIFATSGLFGSFISVVYFFYVEEHIRALCQEQKEQKP